MKYFRTPNEAGYDVKDKFCNKIRDNNLKYELLKHKQQFFNWIVAGAIEYYKHLGQFMDIMPLTFKKAKTEYIHQNDPVQQFIEEFCDIDPSYNVPVTGFQTKLRKEYGLTAKDFTSQMISKIMSEKGFEKKQYRATYGGVHYNTICYMGIRIMPTEDY